MRFCFFVLVSLLCFSGCTVKTIGLRDAVDMKDGDLIQTLRKQLELYHAFGTRDCENCLIVRNNLKTVQDEVSKRTHDVPKEYMECYLWQRICVGMSKELVQSIKGIPHSKNFTTTAQGTMEIWTYVNWFSRKTGGSYSVPSLYVYFMEGRVAMTQG